MINFLSRLILSVIIIGASHVLFAQQHSIIPQPVKVQPSTGVFQITASTRIVIRGLENELKYAANALNAYIQQQSGFALKVVTGESPQQNVIVLSTGLSADSLGNEGYQLRVEPQRISVAGSQAAGVVFCVVDLISL